MITKKAELGEKLKETVIRIDNLIDDYYDKYHIEAEAYDYQKVYDYLLHAFDSCKNLVYLDSCSGDFLCSVKTDFTEGDEIQAMLSYIEMSQMYVREHYNEDFAHDVKNIINKIYTMVGDIVSEENSEKISKIKNSLNCTNYIESHEEYSKLKYLFDVRELIFSDIFRERLNRVIAIGAITTLEEFEKELIDKIAMIEDKYLKSTILYYFKDTIDESKLNF